MKQVLITIFSLGLIFHSIAQISGVAPNKGNRGQTLPIIISGSTGNFASQGSGTVIWLQQGSFTIGPGSSTANQASSSIKNVVVVNSSQVTADVTIPGSSTLGFYDVKAFSNGNLFTGNGMFEILQGSVTAVGLQVGGGKPGTTVQEKITWTGIDLSGQNAEKMWLSKDGNTISTLYNPTIVHKDTDVLVDIDIPSNASAGFWNVNLLTNTGDILVSPASFHINSSFSVKDYSFEDAQILVYPNPAQHYIKVEFDKNYDKDVEIRMVDIQGKTIAKQTQNAGSSMSEFDVSRFGKGIYFIQIVESNKVLTTQKWIKN